MSTHCASGDCRRRVRIAIQGFVTFWAGLWATFAVLEYVHESVSLGGFVYLAKFVLLLLVPVVAAWLWPRAGGILLVATGVYDAFFYHHPFVWAALAAPAIVAGAALCLIGGDRSRRQAKPAAPSD